MSSGYALASVTVGRRREDGMITEDLSWCSYVLGALYGNDGAVDHARESGQPVASLPAALVGVYNTITAGQDWCASSPSARAIKRLQGLPDAFG